MAYCPYCGSKINTEELFCVECGEKLPVDINERFPAKPKRFRLLSYIVSLLLLASIGFVCYYLYLNYQENNALIKYQSAEDNLLKMEFQKAHQQLEKSLTFKENFPEAKNLLQFTDVAKNISAAIEDISSSNYDEKLIAINNGKKQISAFTGTVVDNFQTSLNNQQKEVQLQKVKTKLESEPDIHTLQTILWEAEGIQDPEADEIVTSIQEQLVAYTSTRANDYLTKKQFSNAKKIIEQGLQYVPNSEKLSSLKTTIEKEKTAFETAQEQRIEQAMTAVEAENDKNKNDAVKLKDISISSNDQGEVIVSGELTSVATVPINTIAVHYTITNDDDEVVTENDIYVYPDTLYPDETGKFDHTHFDIDTAASSLQVSIDSITWFLD
ncbi:zinc ribbon domain-containing protein [Paraliobacillus ryukyuensis]|uniref:zinc ribbon domain-containing protein n=1 Tax=Paraliobacillus ryukyuensis TaxID=200904 RepID=UPI0009A687D6|nr:zinc ribbon domain-containing protein [Paraliobacillus ryukyuensis]